MSNGDCECVPMCLDDGITQKQGREDSKHMFVNLLEARNKVQLRELNEVNNLFFRMVSLQNKLLLISTTQHEGSIVTIYFLSLWEILEVGFFDGINSNVFSEVGT